MHDVYIKGEKIKNKKNNWFLISLVAILLIFSACFFIYSYNPLILETQANAEKSGEILPDEQIVINFSKPILKDQSDFKIEIYPKVNFIQKWENYNRKLIIYPENYWPLETDFQLIISGENALFYPVNKEILFQTIDYPKIIEFNPGYGKQDVLLDIEDPIKAVFDKSINNFKIKFTVTPFKDLNSQLDSENNEIRLMPKGDLERGKKYEIAVFVRYKNEKESDYKKIYETFFETKPLPPPEWDKNFTVRLEQAKKFTEPKIKEGKYIDVNLKSQVMVIFENGEPLDAYIVSSGKRGMETPQGDFSIRNKTPRAWSKKYGLFMPYWMAIVSSGDFGIHELPEWPGGYKEGQSHLGTPVSHGCIRLGTGAAERVYDWADIGTPVVIHY